MTPLLTKTLIQAGGVGQLPVPLNDLLPLNIWIIGLEVSPNPSQPQNVCSGMKSACSAFFLKRASHPVGLLFDPLTRTGRLPLPPLSF